VVADLTRRLNLMPRIFGRLPTRTARYAALAIAVAMLAGATTGLAQFGFGQVKAVKSKGHVLVDLEPIAKFFSAKTKYTKRTKALTITKGKTSIGMQVGSQKATLNGKDKTLPAPPQIVDGKTMVPLRWTCEALGGKVAVQDGKMISICAPPPSSQCIAVKMPQ
jgi:hypothetical protein